MEEEAVRLRPSRSALRPRDGGPKKTAAAPTQLAGGDGFNFMRRIIDVNAVSVIMCDFVGTPFHRIPLPGGNGTNPPTAMSVVMPQPTTYPTEDGNGF
jgi:hypothetical protein